MSQSFNSQNRQQAPLTGQPVRSLVRADYSGSRRCDGPLEAMARVQCRGHVEMAVCGQGLPPIMVFDQRRGRP